MVIMDNYYAHDRFHEIWQKIETYHLSYLEMEESPEKLEHRMKLEEYIKNFLCIVSHNQKFSFRVTAEVLHRSASNKKDFSAYKAATGWNAIQLYAGNLLSQPWRKEYRQIRTYCGFYKHQIEANLVGADIMFEAMGYKHIGEGILTLDEPICPDRVANVSKDCLIAYVECQILKMIWEEMTPSFNISWLNILEFREDHICEPEQCVKALKYRQQQRQYQEHTRSYSQGTDIYNMNRCQSNVALTSPIHPINHSFPPLSGHSHIGLPQQAMPQYVYTNGCCQNNYATYASVTPNYGTHYVPIPCSQPIIKPHFNTNGYYYTNGYPAPPNPHFASYPVPTGNLIELDTHNGAYDVVDRGAAPQKHAKPPQVQTNDVYKTNKNNNDLKINSNSSKEKDSEKESFEDWDYVYRDLEIQGYSKDLGERGDILSPPSNDRRHVSKEIMKKTKPTNLDEAMHNLTVNDKPLKMTEALEKIEKDRRKTVDKKPERRNSQSSSYENLSSNDKKLSTKPSTSNITKNKSFQREKVHQLDPIIPKPQPQIKPVEAKKIIKEDKSKSINKEPSFSESKWQCKTCTYINEVANDICEICSKSRGTVLDQPMEIGGAECSKCTLVNKKEDKVCQACGASLKDSPTYI